jgi:uncharacterized protein (DUF433 family)
MALDCSQCPAVESVPGKRSGAWVFRDTRTPVSVVFDNLEVGASIDEIMDWFHLSRLWLSATNSGLLCVVTLKWLSSL